MKHPITNKTSSKKLWNKIEGEGLKGIGEEEYKRRFVEDDVQSNKQVEEDIGDEE